MTEPKRCPICRKGHLVAECSNPLCGHRQTVLASGYSGGPREAGERAREAAKPMLDAGRQLDADALPDDISALRGVYFVASDKESDAFDAALAEIVRLRAELGRAPNGWEEAAQPSYEQLVDVINHLLIGTGSDQPCRYTDDYFLCQTHSVGEVPGGVCEEHSHWHHAEGPDKRCQCPVPIAEKLLAQAQAALRARADAERREPAPCQLPDGHEGHCRFESNP